MKANELRIGNYVSVNDLIVSVNRIEVGKFWATHNDLLFFQGIDTKPIPLTEEWLLKLGFEKKLIQYNNFYCRCKWTIEVNADEYSVYNQYDRYLNTIKYVHQLQNLYFDLTGEELTIVQP